MKNKKWLIFVVVLLVIVVFLGMFKDKILKIIYPNTYKEVIEIYAEEYSVEANLILAVIKAESNFNADAVSNKGAVGLMQLMEKTAIDVAEKSDIDIDRNNIQNELLNADNNINIGTKYLATLLDRYGNKEVALAAYNAGIGNVDGWIDKGIIEKDGSNIENIPYKETNMYVRKILRDYKIYEDLY
mgnify:CR=1 FL=1